MSRVCVCVIIKIIIIIIIITYNNKNERERERERDLVDMSSNRIHAPFYTFYQRRDRKR